MSYETLDEKIDIKKLLDKLWFAEEDVANANINQAKLMFSVSRYRVQMMRRVLQLKAKLELEESKLGFYYRQKLRRGKGDPTAGAIREKVTPKVYHLQKKLNQALVDEELSKQLYECFKQRQLAIKNIFDARRNETAKQLWALDVGAKHQKLRHAARLLRDKYREREDES